MTPILTQGRLLDTVVVAVAVVVIVVVLVVVVVLLRNLYNSCILPIKFCHIYH